MAKNLTLGRVLALMPHCCNNHENKNSIIIGYSEAIGSDEYFNELSQNDVDNLNQTGAGGIAVLLYSPLYNSGGGLPLLSVNDSPSIEANIENEEVVNDLR